MGGGGSIRAQISGGKDRETLRAVVLDGAESGISKVAETGRNKADFCNRKALQLRKGR